MKDTEFAKLTKSIKQAGRIRKGVQSPSRSFDFAPDDIKTIRQRLGRERRLLERFA
jgi:hypothetical protein